MMMQPLEIEPLSTTANEHTSGNTRSDRFHDDEMAQTPTNQDDGHNDDDDEEEEEAVPLVTDRGARDENEDPNQSSFSKQRRHSGSCFDGRNTAYRCSLMLLVAILSAGLFLVSYGQWGDCTMELTNGQGWTDWKEEQGVLLAEQRCRSSLSSSYCQCMNPLEPTSRKGIASWTKTLERNKRLVHDSLLDENRNNNMNNDDNHHHRSLDMVLVGDSLVEHWLGTEHGVPQVALQSHATLYQNLFRNNKNRNPNASSSLLLRGLALGISGDTAPNLLYRLSDDMHGELPSALDAASSFCPPLWWIVIGMNDVYNSNCHVSVAVAGIVQVIEHVLQHQDKHCSPAHYNNKMNHNNNNNGGDHDDDGDAMVVVHSLLPRVGDDDHQYWSKVNNYLQCYVHQKQQERQAQRRHPGGRGRGHYKSRVEFFDATSIFWTTNNKNNNKGRIKESLYFKDGIHPNALGYQQWGIAIMQQSLAWLGRTNAKAFDHILNLTDETEYNDATNALNDRDPESLICTEALTSGQGWQEWKTIQSELPSEDLCDEPSCNCVNPCSPSQRGSGWQATFKRNVGLVEKEQQLLAEQQKQLDMVIMGDSIVEHWLGTDLARSIVKWEENYELYKQLFRNDDSYIHGLALGIGGDRCTGMLYRLQNGEMPSSDTFNPSLWWILVGTNDLYDRCSAEAIVSGIINMAQSIQQVYPSVTVVLHGLLPRGVEPLDRNWWWKEIVEINERLSCYASSQPKTEFFNATNFFLTKDKTRVNETIMPDLLHPTGLGSIEWGKAIVRKSLDLLGRPQPGPDAFDGISLSGGNKLTDATEDNDATNAGNDGDPESLICTEALTSGQGWQEWKTAQSQLPSEDLCSQPSCGCVNPSSPSQRGSGWWQATFERNVGLVEKEQQLLAEQQKQLDMVIIGDSIVEHWLGTDLARSIVKWEENYELYKQLFRNDDSYIHGLALGIGGDRCTGMLYRLQNGEMPSSDTFNPSLWWILVGTNDLYDRCSAEAIVSGIINLAQSIQQVHPSVTVVLHGLLPRSVEPLDWNWWWKEIVKINERLSCYASSQPKTEFFNATNFFLTKDKTRVNETIMPDFLHPNGLGSIEWGKAIVRKSLDLLGRPQPGPDAFDGISLSGGNKLTDETEDNDATSAGNDRDPESLICTEALTSGQGWQEWKTAQSELPSGDLCSQPSCNCVSPCSPSQSGSRWQETFERNVGLVEKEQQLLAEQQKQLDMVITGDSIVEHWLGTDLAWSRNKWEENYELYKQLFRNDDSYIHGLALGIGGDRCTGMLYRLQNGEMPSSDMFNPSLWWILVGTNDLYDRCSAEAIVSGIINLAQSIQQVHPSVTVVLHGLLPRGVKPLDRNWWWKEIIKINERLSCYASSQPKTEFFNATSFFLTKDKTRVNETIMPDLLHPNGLGSIEWGKAIVRKSLDLLGRPQPGLDAFDGISLSGGM